MTGVDRCRRGRGSTQEAVFTSRSRGIMACVSDKSRARAMSIRRRSGRRLVEVGVICHAKDALKASLVRGKAAVG